MGFLVRVRELQVFGLTWAGLETMPKAGVLRLAEGREDACGEWVLWMHGYASRAYMIHGPVTKGEDSRYCMLARSPEVSDPNRLHEGERLHANGFSIVENEHSSYSIRCSISMQTKITKPLEGLARLTFVSVVSGTIHTLHTSCS